jgi:hypothetical protein
MSEHLLLDHEEKEMVVHVPGLLKALCILTWLGSTALFVLALFLLARGIDPFLDSPILLANNLLAQAGNIFAVIGAAMMWKLKKRGFWIYVAAEIIPLSTAAVIMFHRNEFSDVASSGVFGGTLLVRFAFIAMYYRYCRIFS